MTVLLLHLQQKSVASTDEFLIMRRKQAHSHSVIPQLFSFLLAKSVLLLLLSLLIQLVNLCLHRLQTTVEGGQLSVGKVDRQMRRGHFVFIPIISRGLLKDKVQLTEGQPPVRLIGALCQQLHLPSDVSQKVVRVGVRKGGLLQALHNVGGVRLPSGDEEFGAGRFEARFSQRPLKLLRLDHCP